MANTSIKNAFERMWQHIVAKFATKDDLNTKQNIITGAATTITGSNLTASRALVSDANGKVAVSAVTSTELGYLDGVTSAVQTQLDGKAASSHNHSTSNITSGTLGVARGGTGKATHTSNAVLTGNGTSAVNNVATASGALYATAANGAAKFGTLPIAQGGTGATSAANALKNLGTAPATADTTYPSCYYRTVDGVKEWINPPMVSGVEYRTTERFGGRPVYTQLIECGAAANGKTVAHGIPWCYHVRYAGRIANLPCPVEKNSNFSASVSVDSDLIYIWEKGYDGQPVVVQLWYVYT